MNELQSEAKCSMVILLTGTPGGPAEPAGPGGPC